MYCSFRSRWVLLKGYVVSSKQQYSSFFSFLSSEGHHSMAVAWVGYIYLWAWRFNSCRRVKAGLLSGLGPRRFGSWPSTMSAFMSIALSWVGRPDSGSPTSSYLLRIGGLKHLHDLCTKATSGWSLWLLCGGASKRLADLLRKPPTMHCSGGCDRHLRFIIHRSLWFSE